MGRERLPAVESNDTEALADSLLANLFSIKTACSAAEVNSNLPDKAVLTGTRHPGQEINGLHLHDSGYE